MAEAAYLSPAATLKQGREAEAPEHHRICCNMQPIYFLGGIGRRRYSRAQPHSGAPRHRRANRGNHVLPRPRFRGDNRWRDVSCNIQSAQSWIAIQAIATTRIKYPKRLLEIQLVSRAFPASSRSTTVSTWSIRQPASIYTRQKLIRYVKPHLDPRDPVISSERPDVQSNPYPHPR